MAADEQPSAHNAGVLLLTCMVSYTAMPAVTTPPGELMYMLICMQQTCNRCHPAGVETHSRHNVPVYGGCKRMLYIASPSHRFLWMLGF
jgi:hypothetical protein